MHASISTLWKISIRLVLGLLLAIALFWMTFPAQSSRIAFVSYHALLAFLAVPLASLAFLRNYRAPSSSRYILYLSFLFQCIIHFGISVVYSFIEPDLSPANAPNRAFTDLLAIFFFGVLLCVSLILSFKESQRRVSIIVGGSVLLFTLGLYGAAVFILRPILTLQQLESLTIIIAFFTMGLFALAVALTFKTPRRNAIHEPHYFIAALLAFFISSISILAYAIGYYSIWTMVIYQEALAFSLLFLAMGEPLYRESTISKRATEYILSFLLALSLATFTLSLLSEAFAPGVQLIDFGAYLLSHGAAALLSAMMTVLLFVYFQKKPGWNLFPLMTLYLTWTFIEIIIIVSFPSYYMTINGESVVPYIFGGLMSLLVINRGIMYTNRPPREDPREYEYRWILPRLLIVIIGTSGSILIENRIISENPAIIGFPLGRVILLTINLLALFGFSLLLYIITRKSADWKNIEGVAVIILAFFIVPGILKGVFPDWTIGWWLSELVILAGLGAGPPLLGTLYVDSMSKAEDSQHRATLYSDLLVHDITNMHQAILVALSLLEAELEGDESYLSTITDAKQSLDRAADIVSSVRQIGLADQMDSGNLKNIDIVKVLFTTFHQIQSEHPNDSIQFSVNRLPGECYTKANSLLMDLFYNLFRNAVNYSDEEKRVRVMIKESTIDGAPFWNISVEDYGRGIEESRKKELFQRFMRGAEGIGLGLSVVLALTKSFNGYVEVLDRVPGDHTKGTVFVISLPIIHPDELDIT